jgi:hypothetical protein
MVMQKWQKGTQIVPKIQYENWVKQKIQSSKNVVGELHRGPVSAHQTPIVCMVLPEYSMISKSFLTLSGLPDISQSASVEDEHSRIRLELQKT